MKKDLAILYIGLVRKLQSDKGKHDLSIPESVDWCAENIKLMQDNFKHLTNDTYLFSWDCKSSRDLVNKNLFTSHTLIKEPTNEECNSVLTEVPTSHDRLSGAKTAYGMFIGIKMLLNQIRSLGREYKHVVISRLDVRIKLSGEKWVNEDINCIGTHPDDANDQIFSMPLSIAYKAFCNDLDYINSKLKNSWRFERTYQDILMDSARVRYHERGDPTDIMFFIQREDIHIDNRR